MEQSCIKTELQTTLNIIAADDFQLLPAKEKEQYFIRLAELTPYANPPAAQLTA